MNIFKQQEDYLKIKFKIRKKMIDIFCVLMKIYHFSFDNHVNKNVLIAYRIKTKKANY